MVSTDGKKSRLFLRLGARRPLLCSLVIAVLLPGIPPHRAQAQEPTDNWDGTVEVRPTRLTIEKGGSASYELQLTQVPTDDDPSPWWVMINVTADGVGVTSDGYGGITWVPSVGWEIRDTPNKNLDPNSPPPATRWYTVTLYAAADASVEKLTITHDVWDHTTEPLAKLSGCDSVVSPVSGV